MEEFNFIPKELTGNAAFRMTAKETFMRYLASYSKLVEVAITTGPNHPVVRVTVHLLFPLKQGEKTIMMKQITQKEDYDIVVSVLQNIDVFTLT